MSRPRLVRADTLDLQDHHSPSAKDHSKQPADHASLAAHLGPHQEQTLRHADQDSKAEIMHGPDNENNQQDTDKYHDGIDIYDDVDELDGDLGHHHQRGGDSEEGDLADEESDDLLDDDLMDKISSSPSIDDEDIDFEFVYALHNFVATVDGQANAAKGDTMVLLDDSNSYWWLVRIVKDGSIGYLPAEHIETPTERLARLNKHRNVDLSATMLGDNSEKSKNPLKKAMRRRNAKTVTFTAPTYIEASDIEFSTDDELDDRDSLNDEEEAMRGDGDDLRDSQNNDIVVEPLRTKSQRDKGSETLENIRESQESERISLEKQLSSQEMHETESEIAVSRSRNGTVRNTDSFFKDDTLETKKISLTPNLLRDEIGNGTLSSDSKEGRASSESFDKALGLNDKGKDDKKRRDKKPGMLSGLFKRKDKKSKTSEDDTEEPEKLSGEISRTSPTPKTSSETLSFPDSRSSRPLAAQKQSSKLQKQPPAVVSPTKQDFQHEPVAQELSEAGEEAMLKVKQKADTIRQVVAEESDVIPLSIRSKALEDTNESVSSPTDTSGPSEKPSAGQFSSVPSPPEVYNGEPQNSYDRTMDSQHPVISPPQRFLQKQDIAYQNRDIESPVNGSPLEARASPGAIGLTVDVQPPREYPSSPVSPLSPDVDTNNSNAVDETLTPLDRVSPEALTWSDASLRSYLDDDNDIRDLFIIVHDNSNIPPAGPDHPITGSLFKEESKRLKEMTSHLDLMLADWVSRRMHHSTATK